MTNSADLGGGYAPRPQAEGKYKTAKTPHLN